MRGNMNSKEIVISIISTIFKVVCAVIIIMLVYRGTLLAYEYGQRVFNEPPVTTGSGRSIRITVNEGDTAAEIGETLLRNGLIRDARLFVVQELLSQYKDGLQPGTYELNTSMTTDEMMEIMASGEVVVDIPEESIEATMPENQESESAGQLRIDEENP